MLVCCNLFGVHLSKLLNAVNNIFSTVFSPMVVGDVHILVSVSGNTNQIRDDRSQFEVLILKMSTVFNSVFLVGAVPENNPHAKLITS